MNIDLPDGQTWYEYNNITDAVCIVFISGIGFSSEVFNFAIPFFNARGFTTLRYDLFGRGKSSRPKAVYSLNFYVRQLEQLIQKLPISRRCILIGTSFGADIAVAFGATIPDQIKKIVLLAPSSAGIHFPSWYPILFNTGIIEKLTPILAPVIGKYMLRKSMTSPFRNKDFLKSQEHLFDVPGTGEAMLSFMRCFLDPKQHIQMETCYGALKDACIPVCALFGNRDRIITKTPASAFTSRYPWLQSEFLPDAGHIAIFEQADTVLPAVFNVINTPDTTGK